ncbi:MAG TPA: efflux RND transporter permease subunit [Urbifossiella sp.]|nr:efflux RND transporter permease subunit [Urbifossiella sp.]
MNPIVFALRNPVTVMVGVVAVLVGSGLAAYRTRVDVFPALNQPVIYVCQPYGGMTPQQMEGLLTSYYEFHFLYVNAVHHIESRNIQGMTLLKVYFQPGTDMGQAMAEVVGTVNRARYMMPPNTVPPFITRLDTGSAGVGYLVLSSQTKSIKDIQDMATLKVRPMFAAVAGMSSPPAFGGNQRAVVVSVDPERLRAQGLTLDQITEAVAAGNTVSPSGNMRIGDRNYLVTTNVMVGADPARELGVLPVRLGEHPVLLRDVADIADAADITAGYALVNGRRSVFVLVTKRADASTLSVVKGVRAALPKMRDAVPEDVTIDFTFDQSEIVTESMWGVAAEGLIGALLTGLMVLLFLRDWRSVIVVVLNIPLALAAALFALWVAGQTVNLMTLGGLALAVGILVDEATVEVENIHTQMLRYEVVARAVRRGNQETAVPRLLAMLCILAVFVPSFFMDGAARELFVPLSLAVGFAMIASYFLSSTFVPVLCVWLLKPIPTHAAGKAGFFDRVQTGYEAVVARIVYHRRLVVVGYLAAAAALVVALYTMLGTAIFPPTDKGQFLLRMRAPTGTRVERTEELAQEATRLIKDELGAGRVAATVGYVGMFPTNYPIQAVHQWTSGPDEVLLRVALHPGSGVRVEEQKARLRDRLDAGLKDWLAARYKADGLPPDQAAARLPGLRLSFEPGDLVSEVMSFGAPTPVEVQVSGSNMATNLGYAETVRAKLAALPTLRDVYLNPAQDYPTIDISLDRARAATMGVTSRAVGFALVPATASSRYMNPIYWRDPAAGQAYIVQIQVPPPAMSSVTEIGIIPVRGTAGMSMNGAGHGYGGMTGMTGGATGGSIHLRDVATIRETTSPAEIDRYDMRRVASVTATVATQDLGLVRRQVFDALAACGDPPRGVNVDVRGQLETLRVVQSSLGRGLAAAVLAIVLLLVAYFQSVRLAVVSVAALPATLCGVGLMLAATGTTLNLQSFMGAIMALGVSVANAILLVTFAERARTVHGGAVRAAVEGGRARLRPILMTSCAMVAGMLPMAVGAAAGGEQTAPLGRAVVGGLVASTLATLFLLPAVFAVVQRRTSVATASLDPDDPHSNFYDEDKVKLFEEP